MQENFSVAEELKRKQQIEAFIRRTQPKSTHSTFLDRWNPYRLFKGKPKAIAVDNLPPNLVLPLKKSIVRDFADARAGPSRTGRGVPDESTPGEEGIVSFIKRTLDSKSHSTKQEHVPMDDLTTAANSLAADEPAGLGASARDVDRQL